MKEKRLLGGAVVALLSALLGGLTLAQSPEGTLLGTAFTYQGYLKSGNVPVDGPCDLRFSLWDAESGGSQIGPLEHKTGVSISQGLFIVPLNFGEGAFKGDARWLEIAVHCSGDPPGYTTLTPRQALTATPYALALPGLWTQQGITSTNIIGGWSGNWVAENVIGATIGGGGGPDEANSVTGNFGTVAGGSGNQAAYRATVGGGGANVASGWRSTIAGGVLHTASDFWATIGGGFQNTAGGVSSTVAGGECNSASGDRSTVGAGYYNTANGPSATVGGGDHNTAGSEWATVAGGDTNIAEGSHATIGGGSHNSTDGEAATVGGGQYNTASGEATTIGGGGGNTVTGPTGVVGGGAGNLSSGHMATVAGGADNIASGDAGFVGGGQFNTAGGGGSTIGGGGQNEASAEASTVAGGEGNVASATGGTVSGGRWNTASGDWSPTVGGGENNTASAGKATVGGGWGNTASGYDSTVPGGSQNRAEGNSSFAAGHRAVAHNDGAFVWADWSDYDFVSSGYNSFNARATGGFWFWTGLDGSGNPSVGAVLPSGSSAWSPLSDRDLKANVAPVDTEQLLARLAEVPVSTWSYTTQDPSIRHIGPMAQDFYAAFGVGEDERRISTVDADGVALAALQGLYAENQALKSQLAGMEARLSALEQGTAGEQPAQAGTHLPVPWFLAGGLVVAGGALAGWRRRPGGAR